MGRLRLDQCLVLTPPHAKTATVAIAACRAGATGVLDLEFELDRDRSVRRLRELEHYTSSEFGIKIGFGGGPFLDRLQHDWPDRLRWAIVAGGPREETPVQVALLRRHNVRVLVEAVSVEEAETAQGVGADGVVLKGEEAGGRIGSATAFVLLQACLGRAPIAVWVQGGIGLHTSAACLAAGATGLVLDAQVLLAREAELDPLDRKRLEVFDGNQTVVVGERLGFPYRVYHDPISPVIDRLNRLEDKLLASKDSSDRKGKLWWEGLCGAIGDSGQERLWPLGQDAGLAEPLGKRFRTVAGIVHAVREGALEGVRRAARANPLAEGSLFAQRHDTRHSIVQGPMTRVSDTADFAEIVAREGALPLVALGMMRRGELETLLAETKARVANRPWGVGILGFLSPEIRREQTEVILAERPPLVLIAGGRPDQAAEFEREGTAVYLHVPSAELLEHYLRAGARRFVFEGRECGGHVGPRTSFVLWETVCQRLLAHVEGAGGEVDLSVLFAGGIHDSRSAAMVAAIAAPLAERGIAVGVLMGTAYLFTREAVECGAVVGRYQEELLRCGHTVLLESGRGHVTRCLDTPYVAHYRQVQERLKVGDKSPEEIRSLLEQMNVGRLRIAAKGVCRTSERAEAPGASGNGNLSKLCGVAEDVQFNDGMYMAGEVAGLRSSVTTVAELHDEITHGSSRYLRPEPSPDSAGRQPKRGPDIAIIGMSCFFPKAGSLRDYWQNILDRREATTEVPLDHWDWRLYYDPDPRAPGKIVSKWGGFLDDIPFDPLRYGMPPSALSSIEPLQMMLLEAVRQALDDAGYAERPFNRERTAVVLGAGGGAAQLSMAYALRAYLPLLETVPGIGAMAAEVSAKCGPLLPQWTEDTFPGILLNVAAGRVANRFNLNGPNFAVDAACGSSLAALYAGVRELQMTTSDVAVVMGGDTVQNPFTYLLFSKTGAFSPTGRSRPFDESADGIVISEGIGVVVLKRLPDAERDGDRIYAVIKGMGASSDGKGRGLTAPRPEGQVRALMRAYDDAGISPARVGMVESHGTGTVVGDRSEVESASLVFREGGARARSCSLGSVKSLIGHTKCAAGLAGFINAALALYHKVRPPMIVEEPNTKARFEETPFFLNRDARPWIHGRAEPRCAGVSAFGFGGTNFHAVLEEYSADYLGASRSGLPKWPAELFLWRRQSREAVIESVDSCRKALAKTSDLEMGGLAASLWDSATNDASQPTLAVVATSPEDLARKLEILLERLRANAPAVSDPRGIYWAESPAQAGGKIAFLFPGQGSQYPDMLAQLAIAFPDVRQTFDRADQLLYGDLGRSLGSVIFPPSAFTPEEAEKAKRDLMRSDIAQPAIGAASLGIFRLLSHLGIQPDFLAGHSYGDFSALCASGALSEEDFLRISYERGRAILGAAGQAGGGMIAVEAAYETLREMLIGIDDVGVANFNGPKQTVLWGSEPSLARVVEMLSARGIAARRIDVSCAFHSPQVAGACEPLAAALAKVAVAPPSRTVYSNTTACPFPRDPEAIKRLLVEHLASAVRFQEEIEAMYDAGARLFVEVGPGSVLTGLVRQILGERRHLSLFTSHRSQSDVQQVQQVLGQLLVHGVDVRLDYLYAGRALRRFPLSELASQLGQARYSPSTWLVNSVRVRPWQAPEPPVFGRPQTSATVAADDSLHEMDGRGVSGRQAAASACGRDGNGRVRDLARERAAAPGSAPIQGTTPPAEPLSELPRLPTDSAEAARVVMGFQDLMSKFLETQRAVMTSYLDGAAFPGLSTADSVKPAGEGLVGERGGLAPFDGGRAVHGGGAPDLQLGMVPPEIAAVTPGTGGDAANSASPPDEPGDLETSREHVATEALTRESLTRQLVEAVSKRTGYPPEMLDLNLNLEADLGVDSIKRVEILSGLTGSNEWADAGAAVEMEKLTSLKSLRAIIDYLVETLERSARHDGSAGVRANGGGNDKRLSQNLAERRGQAHFAPKTPHNEPVPDGFGMGSKLSGHSPGVSRVQRGRAGSDRGSREIRRMLVRPVTIDSPRWNGDAGRPGPLLVTDDGRGIARETARRLQRRGTQAIVVAMPHDNGKSDDAAPVADLTDPHDVQRLVSSIRERFGPPAGLVHLIPLSSAAHASWETRLRREVYSLFLLARELSKQRQADACGPPTTLLAATAMGGSFGSGDMALSETFFAGQGGVAGIVKSLAHEWTDALVRVLDLDADETVSDLVDRIVAELEDTAGPVEVGYFRGERITLECYDAPLEFRRSGAMPLEPDAPVLITGGACGITAEVALELGRQCRCRLMLVGRSPMPAEAESAATAGLTDPGELKAAILAAMRRNGSPPVPAEVESTYRRLLRDREIRGNLARFGKAGIETRYFQADVRDPEALSAVLRQIEGRYGACQGLLHGAGVIDDKLIGDKTPESFDYVFGTKVDSALNLRRLLRPEQLRLCVFFTSVAGRFGNCGQSDYAAGNEVLTKLAMQLDQEWPHRVVSVAWGPWSRIGMVSELEEHLTGRGLDLIPPEVGPRLLLEEAVYGNKGECEVVIAGGVGQLVRPCDGAALCGLVDQPLMDDEVVR